MEKDCDAHANCAVLYRYTAAPLTVVVTVSTAHGVLYPVVAEVAAVAALAVTLALVAATVTRCCCALKIFLGRT